MRSPFSTNTLKAFADDCTAATAIEYSLIASGIAGAIVAVIATLGGSVLEMWNRIGAAFH